MSLNYEKVKCGPNSHFKEGCELARLEEAISRSSDENLLLQIRDIETQLALKLTVQAKDIRADVYAAMLVLEDARDRYRREHPNG